MKTEREKMTDGEIYMTGDAHLMKDKSRARTLAARYNGTTEEEGDLRRSLLKELLGSCDDEIFIKPPFKCDYGYNIFVGKKFFANFDCVMLDAAPIYIGDNCLMGPKTCVYAVNHPMTAAERATGAAKGKAVHIGDNVWFGGNCVVLPGVTIGDNVVVGAGSVVVHDLPDNCLAVGNPARVVRYIDQEERNEFSYILDLD
ncbi:maltose O-acetyltransferase [Catenibacillus scindens]|uniref:Acetyltransferase n=1 Tax=Catenibacillus scindens TaxID=673271 RepID=A0A7W8HBD4_9FIRM|nr:sugar O-acetyltransferase [Catenibacillus scindens]MBB5264582.1 maltose O-acetyltransferase [Catenibacillus scindens]